MDYHDWERIKKFVRYSDFGGGANAEVSESEMLQRNQLRCLWTAWCILQDMEPDTAKYDNGVLMLWCAVIENRDIADSEDTFDNFDAFDLWMGELLC